MSVRAKFRVHNVVTEGWGTRIEMSPVYSSDPNSENRSFWEATPNGSISMTIKNEAAAKYFRPNAEIYVDFTEAPTA